MIKPTKEPRLIVIAEPDLYMGTAIVAELLDIAQLISGPDIGIRVLADEVFDLRLREYPGADDLKFDHDIPNFVRAGEGKRQHRAAKPREIDPSLSRQQRRLYDRQRGKGG